MEYFKAGEASAFFPELTRKLEDSFFENTTEIVDPRDKGIVVRVVPATDENKPLSEAVKQAALGLKGEAS